MCPRQHCQIAIVHYPSPTSSLPTTLPPLPVTPIIVVSLHRPAARNAFTVTIASSIITAFNLLSDDPRVKAIVLASADPANRFFCVGMDLNATHSFVEKAEDPRDPGGRVALAVYRCSKPVIVAVNGSAVGIGITMTLPANIRVASRDAKIGFVFGRRGLTLEACSSFFLPRLIGISRALHLTSTGASYPASHKLLDGLFSEVVAPDEVLPTALKIAEDIANNVSLVASRLMKDMMYRGPDSPEETHLLESKLFHGLIAGADAQEGLASFMEKRRPNFKTAQIDDAPSPYPWWTPVDVRFKPKM